MKQFHQNYGYDVEKVLAKYPIKELGDEQSKKQVALVHRERHLQIVTFQTGGKEERMFITANPEYKALTAYNTTGQKISLRDLVLKEEQTTKQNPIQTVKQEENAKTGVKQKNEKPATKKSRKQKA